MSIVAANWKMHKTLDEGLALVDEISTSLSDREGATVVLFPTFLHLQSVAERLLGKRRIRLGAQNCHYEKEGPYTGEISPKQLQAIAVDYVLIGHSERRTYFHEDSKLLQAKLEAVLAQGMRPILCCGEPLLVREANKHIPYVCGQLTALLSGVEEADFKRIVVAYEPIWAIGTGKTASPEQAQSMHAALRTHLCSLYSSATEIPILYGGSVNPENAAVLHACQDVDGALVGGASLRAADFLKIVTAFE